MKMALLNRPHNRPIKNVIGLLTMLAATAALYAQTNVEDATYNNVRVWVAPAVGGKAEDRAYFDFNLPEEVKGSGYELTNEKYANREEARQESDFYITCTLEYDEEYDDNVIIAELYNTRTGALIITTSMGYQTTEEMNDWNLTMIYRLMANAPISKSLNMDVTELHMRLKRAYPDYRWFLGLRVGYSPRFYTPPPGTTYIEEDFALGNTFEAAFHVSLHPWQHLGFQAEAIFTMDFADFHYYRNNNKNLVLTLKDHRSASLMIPLMVKGIFQIDRFTISPLAGLYFIVPLGQMTGDTTSAFSVTPPMGFLVGAELGMHLGPGLIFFDARYAGDFGNTQIEGTSVYRRSMVTLSLGYKFGLGKKRPTVTNDLQPDETYETVVPLGQY